MRFVLTTNDGAKTLANAKNWSALICGPDAPDSDNLARVEAVDNAVYVDAVDHAKRAFGLLGRLYLPKVDAIQQLEEALAPFSAIGIVFDISGIYNGTSDSMTITSNTPGLSIRLSWYQMNGGNFETVAYLC